jgi:hypothetical protein
MNCLYNEYSLKLTLWKSKVQKLLRAGFEPATYGYLT